MPNYDVNNVFAKIIRGELSAKKFYEDERVLAIADMYPQAPTHILFLPKGEYISIHEFAAKAPAEDIAHFYKVIQQVAEQLQLDKTGYRLITNHGADAMQTVPHFHMHLLGNKKLGALIV